MSDKSESNFIPSLEFVRAFQRFVGEVFRLNGQLLTTADLLSRDLEVSTARWQTIAVIRNEPMTVAAIARRLGLTRQSVQQTVNRLERQDLVEFVDNPNHRTSLLVRLTGHGHQIMDILRDRADTADGYVHRGPGSLAGATRRSDQPVASHARTRQRDRHSENRQRHEQRLTARGFDMPAYMIVHATLTDRDKFISGYAPAAARLVERFGGRYLLRGAGATVLEGDLDEGASVVISEWPDMDAALRFWNSREYEEVKKLRADCANCRVTVIEAPAITG